MTEVATGGPATPESVRKRGEFPSFVREPGIDLPPDSSTSVPTEEQALAAHRRYRQHPTEKDAKLVQQWVAAAKGDPVEQARRIDRTR